MGLSGLHYAVKKSKVKFRFHPSWNAFCADFQLTHNGERVGFDLMACFFYFIKKQLFLDNLIGLSEFLIKFFRQLPNLYGVFDGPRSLEKYETGLNRMQSKLKAISKLEEYVEYGKRGKEFKKGHWREIDSKLFLAYTMSSKDLESLKTSLMEAGIPVFTAAFEAD